MNLGNGLCKANHYEDALSVQEAELSTAQRNGVPVRNILCVQNNLSTTYENLGRFEQALRLKRDVYSRRLKVNGEEQEETFRAANNYAYALHSLQRFEESKSVLRKTIPVARRVLGECNDSTLRMRWNYGRVLARDGDATLDDLGEAVATLEEIEPIARRVFGDDHLFVDQVEHFLRESQGLLHKKRKTEATPSPRNSTLS